MRNHSPLLMYAAALGLSLTLVIVLHEARTGAPPAMQLVPMNEALMATEVYVFKHTHLHGTCGEIKPYIVTIPIGSGLLGAQWTIEGLTCQRNISEQTFRCNGHQDTMVGTFSGDDDAVIEASESRTRGCTSSWRVEGRKIRRVVWEP